LSAGEWQKVALARTGLPVAQVVILDEPINAMDALSEQQVMETFWTVTPNCIRILISHRLSAVRQADRIYVLSGGQIVESGNHDELMRMRGSYADLFAAQARSYQ
jgi:ATP-binding cassette subfamily B protein